MNLLICVSILIGNPPRNVDFHIFRICPIMSQSQLIYKTWYIYETHKMAKSLTSQNLPHIFFGKNRIRSIRALNFWYLMLDFNNGQQKVADFGVIMKFVCNFNHFWAFLKFWFLRLNGWILIRKSFIYISHKRAYWLRIFRKLSSGGRGFEPHLGLYFCPIILVAKKIQWTFGTYAHTRTTQCFYGYSLYLI